MQRKQEESKTEKTRQKKQEQRKEKRDRRENCEKDNSRKGEAEESKEKKKIVREARGTQDSEERMRAPRERQARTKGKSTSIRKLLQSVNRGRNVARKSETTRRHCQRSSAGACHRINYHNTHPGHATWSNWREPEVPPILRVAGCHTLLATALSSEPADTLKHPDSSRRQHSSTHEESQA